MKKYFLQFDVNLQAMDGFRQNSMKLQAAVKNFLAGSGTVFSLPPGVTLTEVEPDAIQIASPEVAVKLLATSEQDEAA